jgi:hypothetical protein
MDVIEGEALTTDGSRLLRRLCKHWGHKFAVEYDDAGGSIQLGEVKVVMRAAPDRLHLRLENLAGEVPRRLEGVVAEHLQRMAGDPQLPVNWHA